MPIVSLIMAIPGVQTRFGDAFNYISVVGFLSCPPVDGKEVTIFSD